MQLPYQTLRDKNLDHQVVLFTPSGSSQVLISCNCLREKTVFGHSTYVPMGSTEDLDESRDLYNEPTNHRLPFFEEDEAKW